MHLTELIAIAVVVLVTIVGVSMLAGRLRVAAPLALVVVGIGVGFLPGMPAIEIDPEIILMGVLPPLLYAAAVNVPVMDLRRNIGPVAGLSVVLVLISAVVVGVLLHAVVPVIPLAACVALGAVVAPTDAVAATSIGKRLGMPPRLVTILEGESLVNDATSLVLLRAAIAATAGGFAFWETAGLFVYALVVAAVVGLLIGFLTVAVRSRISNPVFDTVISFTVPFIAFLPAEELGASGVVAVVAAGLYAGHQAPRRLSVAARTNERLNWRTVQFLLEHGVFLLMGLELHSLLTDVQESDVTIVHLGALAVGVVVVLISIRMIFMPPLLLGLRGQQRRAAARAELAAGFAERLQHEHAANAGTDDAVHPRRLARATRRAAQRHADVAHERSQGLDWRGTVILGWSGMRGVVTLAAAQSIPESVPYRSQLVLLAFLAAVMTLLLHGLSLPTVVRVLRPSGPSRNARADELLSLRNDLLEEGMEAIEPLLPSADTPEAEQLTRRIVSGVQDAVAPLLHALGPDSTTAHPAVSADVAAYLTISRKALEAQRAKLLEERAIGRYSSEALRAAERSLDAHELRLTPPASGH